MTSNNQQYTADLLQDIAITVEDTLSRMGIEKDKSSEAGLAACNQVRDRFGGSLIYIPKDLAAMAKLEHDRIRADFDGANHRILAAKYGKSVQHIYKILRSKEPIK